MKEVPTNIWRLLMSNVAYEWNFGIGFYFIGSSLWPLEGCKIYEVGSEEKVGGWRGARVETLSPTPAFGHITLKLPLLKKFIRSFYSPHGIKPSEKLRISIELNWRNQTLNKVK